MRSRIALACVSLAVVAVLSVPQFRARIVGLNQDQSLSLRLATNVWSGYEPLYLARKLGYYDDRSVRLVECSSASQVIRSFRNKAIEVAALTLDEALLLQEDGYDIRVILVTDISHGGDVILAKPELADLTELRGRNVGVEHTALGAYVLTQALQRAGMSAADVKVVPLEIHEHESAFDEGTVDAVVTFEPVRSRLLAKGATTVFDSSQMTDEIVDVLVVRSETIKDSPEKIAILLSGWFSALKHLRERPEKASQELAERLRLEPRAVLASFDGIRFPDLGENLLLLGGTRPKLSKIAERLAKVMVEQKLLQREVDVSELFSALPLKQIKETPTLTDE